MPFDTEILYLLVADFSISHIILWHPYCISLNDRVFWNTELEETQRDEFILFPVYEQMNTGYIVNT